MSNINITQNKNTVTVNGTRADVITLAASAGTDTIKTLVQSDVDATMVEIVNFQAGAAGDVLDIELKAQNI